MYAERYAIPLFAPASSTESPQGVLRIVNGEDNAGTVSIWAIDDAGIRTGPAIFTLNASAAIEFDAAELAAGNAAKGLSGGVGRLPREMRLEIETDLDIVPLAFARSADGTLSAVHDTVDGVTSGELGTHRYDVPIFYPASEVVQASRLRLINLEDEPASVTIRGRDDFGAEAPGGSVRLTIPAGGARSLAAQQLEAGGTGLTGRLGAGTGRWRLTVSSDRPLQAVNVATAGTGWYWNNLSTAPKRSPSWKYNSVPLFATAGTPGAPRGMLRILNGADETGTVEIWAIDDAGTRFGPVTFTLNARASAEFGAADLVSGNPAKGLSGGIGPVEGYVRLVIDTDLEIVPLAYARAADGALSAMHDTVPATAGDAAAKDTGGDAIGEAGSYRYEVPTFNPSSEAALASRLRLVNPGDDPATVTIEARDDSGAAAPGGSVALTLPGGAARTLTALRLEAGGASLTGRLGAGTGRWQLTVSSNQPLQAVNLAETSTGYLNNLSTAAASASVDDTDDHGNDRATATEVEAGSDTEGVLDSGDVDYFRIVVDAAGALEAYTSGGIDTRGWLEDANGAELGTDDDGGAGTNFRISEDVSPGTYFIRVEGYSTRVTGDYTLHVRFTESDSSGGQETAFGAGDTISGLPSGTWSPDAMSGARVETDTGATRIVLDEGGYIETGGYRYTCRSADGCEIAGGEVVSGSIVQTPATGPPPTADPVEPLSFAADSAPGSQAYTIGTSIAVLTLPEASGGEGTPTYILAPNVPGLSFDAASRSLTGTPTTAGVYAMTYTATDTGGNTATLDFTISVAASLHSNHGEWAGWVRSSRTVPDGIGRIHHVNNRFYGQFGGSLLAFREVSTIDNIWYWARDDSRDIQSPVGGAATYEDGRFYFFSHTSADTMNFLAVSHRPYDYGVRDEDADLSFHLEKYSDFGDYPDAFVDITRSDERFHVLIRASTGTTEDTYLVYTYSLDGQRDEARDIVVVPANALAYADGRLYLISGRKAIAYRMDGQRDEAADFDLYHNNRRPTGITYANGQLYVSDHGVNASDTQIFVYVAGEQADEDEASRTFGAGAEISGLPSGSWMPDTSSGARIDVVGDITSIRLDDGGYIERGGYRYVCRNAGGCDIRDGDVEWGTIVRTPGVPAPPPSFSAGTSVDDRLYTSGAAIAELTLPAASGGDGALTYALTPNVPGLDFDTATRRLTGAPTETGTYNMTLCGHRCGRKRRLADIYDRSRSGG